MNKIFETTLIKPLSFKGIGLHSGLSSEIKIFPSKSGSGISFKRTDVEKNNIVQANYKKVTSSKLCTTLENDYGVKVSTVEHLLAALYIAEIDNALIEINTEEVPIMDGSAKNFIDVIKNSEVKTLPIKRKFLKVINKFEFKEGKRKISIEPNDDTFHVEFELDYENKLIGKQKNNVDFQKDNLNEIIESRTFCLYEDIKKIKKIGLAKGGSLENAIVVDKNKVLNEGGLRNQKEFVNHKILDLAGDFVLSGHRIIGKVKCHQGGHELSNLFLKNLFLENENYNIIELNNERPTKLADKNYTQLAVNA